VALWPFQHLETRLGMLFVGSIWVAEGTAALWFGVSGDLRASGGGALAGIVIFAGVGCYLLSRSGQTVTYGIIGALCLAVSLAFAAESSSPAATPITTSVPCRRWCAGRSSCSQSCCSWRASR
jgi:hypothetical protein